MASEPPTPEKPALPRGQLVAVVVVVAGVLLLRRPLEAALEAAGVSDPWAHFLTGLGVLPVAAAVVFAVVQRVIEKSR